MADPAPPRPLSRGLADFIDIARAGSARGSAGLALLLLALVLVNAILLPGQFATFGTLQSMMFQLPELGMLALAMVIALISGGLNLAIIATANQCALLMAYILKAIAPADASGGMITLAILAALAAGLLLALVIGLVTGVLIANMGVHPILVTLGTMSVINGISIYLTRGTVIAGLPEPFLVIGNGIMLGVPVPFLILIAAAILVAFILNRTPFGIAVFMIGSNLEAARYAAIDTKRVLIGVYTMSSLLCYLAAILMLSRFNSASAGYAESYLLITILAAVLGGVDPFGGFGRISGLMLALAILQVISSSFNLLGLSQHLTLAIWGLTLVAVMGFKAVAAPIARRLFARTTTVGKDAP
jgi:simple sugar transport system permease protein